MTDLLFACFFHINIPLTSFNESGSWDNDSWYNPEGKFDWRAIDRFEISTEYSGTTGKQLWFDNIHITNRDSAIVRESGVLGVKKISDQTGLYLKVAPNPMKYSATVSYNLAKESHISICIFSATGQIIRTLLNETQSPGFQSLTWDGCGDNGVPVQCGLYICVLKVPGYLVARKIIKS